VRPYLQLDAFIGCIVDRAATHGDVVGVVDIGRTAVTRADVEALAVVLPLARVVNGAVIKRDEGRT